MINFLFLMVLLFIVLALLWRSGKLGSLTAWATGLIGGVVIWVSDLADMIFGGF